MWYIANTRSDTIVDGPFDTEDEAWEHIMRPTFTLGDDMGRTDAWTPRHHTDTSMSGIADKRFLQKSADKKG